MILKQVYPTTVRVMQADAGVWIAAVLLISAIIAYVRNGPLVVVLTVGILQYLAFVFLRQLFAGESMFRLKKMGLGLRRRAIKFFLILPTLWYLTFVLSLVAVFYVMRLDVMLLDMLATSDVILSIYVGIAGIWLLFELALLVWFGRILCAAATGAAIRPALKAGPFIRSLPGSLTCIILTLVVVGMIAAYVSQFTLRFRFNPDSNVPFLLRQFLAIVPAATALVIFTASTMAVCGLVWRRSNPVEDMSLVRVFE